MPKTCPKCSKSLKDTAIWCFYCGAKVDAVVESHEDTYKIYESYYSKPAESNPQKEHEEPSANVEPAPVQQLVVEAPAQQTVRASDAVLDEIEKMESKPLPAPIKRDDRMPLLSMEITRDQMPDAKEMENSVNNIIRDYKVPKRIGEKTIIALDSSKKQLLYGTLTNLEMMEKRHGKVLNARGWQMLGNAFYGIGDFEKAVRCYDKALGEDKGFRHAWEGKGYALRHLGEEAGSNHCFGTLRTLRSAFNGWLEKGNMHAKKGELDLAIECYKRASELDPDDEKPLFNLGLALKRMGKFDEAIQAYDKALAISEDPETWNNKGNALARLGRFDEAVESFRNALRLKPDYETARVNMTICANKLVKQ